MARFERNNEVCILALVPAERQVDERVLIARGERGALPEPSEFSPPIEGAPVAPRYVARRRYQQMARRLLGDGWQRVVESVDGEPRAGALEMALRADASDVHTKLIYADWLLDRGHPRGELIIVQHARAGRDSSMLADKERRLLEMLGERPFGGSAENGGEEIYLCVTWHCGFVHRVELRRRGDTSHVRRATDDVLWGVLTHPAARLLSELALAKLEADEGDYRSCVALLLQRDGPTPLLRVLSIADHAPDDTMHVDLEWPELGDLSSLSGRYPDLRSLVLRGALSLDRPLALPALRELGLHTLHLSRSTLEKLVAPLPALCRLDVSFEGDRDRSSDLLLERARLPMLRHLVLRDTHFSDALIDHLARSSLTRQLDTLSLTHGILTDEGARHLAAQRDVFASLQKLDLTGSRVTPAGIELVTSVCRRVVIDDST